MLPTPGLPSFDYACPETAQEVSKILRTNPDARLFMGGTDVFVRMRDGVICPRVLVDCKHLPKMREIRYAAGHGLVVGAAVDMNTLMRHPAVVQHYPLLVEALDSVASYQLRTRATMGGNLCNASPAADTAPAALVLNANLVLQGPRGERSVPASQFFLGPGKTVLKRGEFLLRIEIPPMQRNGAGRYLKLGRNAHGDLSIVGVAALAWPNKKMKSGYCFRLALASVAPTPIRVPEAEEILSAAPLSPEVMDWAAAAAMETAQPIDDVRASAAYRKAMVRTLTKRAIESVLVELRAVRGDQ